MKGKQNENWNERNLAPLLKIVFFCKMYIHTPRLIECLAWVQICVSLILAPAHTVWKTKNKVSWMCATHQKRTQDHKRTTTINKRKILFHIFSTNRVRKSIKRTCNRREKAVGIVHVNEKQNENPHTHRERDTNTKRITYIHIAYTHWFLFHFHSTHTMLRMGTCIDAHTRLSRIGGEKLENIFSWNYWIAWGNVCVYSDSIFVDVWVHAYVWIYKHRTCSRFTASTVPIIRTWNCWEKH